MDFFRKKKRLAFYQSPDHHFFFHLYFRSGRPTDPYWISTSISSIDERYSKYFRAVESVIPRRTANSSALTLPVSIRSLSRTLISVNLSMPLGSCFSWVCLGLGWSAKEKKVSTSF